MKVLVLDVLCTPFDVKQADLMSEVLGLTNAAGQGKDIYSSRISLRTIHADREPFSMEDLLWADKIIISGSFKSVYENISWINELRRGIDLILKNNIPTHAICFGSQLVAYHLGAKVQRNPRGIEFGSVELSLTGEGLKHDYLGETFVSEKVHSSHKDVIEEVPPGAILLAYNNLTPVQAFEYGPIFATQFHTDYPVWFMEKLLDHRREMFMECGLVRDEKHLEEVRKELQNGRVANAVLWKFLGI